jgi:hypothetical protein
MEVTAIMAVRAEELQQEDLLTRYLEASKRYARPTRALGTNDLLLARYLKALQRHGPPEAAAVTDDFRTCVSCGRHARFEPIAGGWATCATCGALA